MLRIRPYPDSTSRKYFTSVYFTAEDAKLYGIIGESSGEYGGRIDFTIDTREFDELQPRHRRPDPADGVYRGKGAWRGRAYGVPILYFSRLSAKQQQLVNDARTVVAAYDLRAAGYTDIPQYGGAYENPVSWFATHRNALLIAAGGVAAGALIAYLLQKKTNGSTSEQLTAINAKLDALTSAGS
jgi:hypothetical protein